MPKLYTHTRRRKRTRRRLLSAASLALAVTASAGVMAWWSAPPAPAAPPQSCTASAAPDIAPDPIGLDPSVFEPTPAPVVHSGPIVDDDERAEPPVVFTVNIAFAEHMERGERAMQRKAYRAALKHFRAAIALGFCDEEDAEDPSDDVYAEAHGRLGDALLELGDSEGAKDAWRRSGVHPHGGWDN